MNTIEGAKAWTDHERVLFLLEAAREVGRTLDESRIYASLLKLVKSMAPVDGLVVSAFDPVTELIHCQFAWSEGVELDVRELPPIQWQPNGQGMQSQVIRTGKAQIFDIPAKVREPNTSYIEVGPDGATKQVQDEPTAKSAMMAPMLLEGNVAGVIQVMSNTAQAFSPYTLEAFDGLTTIVTPSWHNARTYQRASQERRFTDRILGTSPDVIYVFNLRDHKIEFANGQLEKQFGYGEQELADMVEGTLLEVMAFEDHHKFFEVLERFKTAKDSDLIESEWSISTKDGNWRLLHNRSRVFERDENGLPLRVLGFSTDITEQRQAEQQLRETESLYRLLAESGPNLVWAAKPDGTLDFVNDRWRDEFGIEALADPEGRLQLIHEADREESLASYRKAIEAGTPFECEYRLKSKDGSYRWFLCRGEPLKNEQGEVTRWLGILLDNDEQKEVELELEQRVAERTAELEAAVKELEGFTYTVSHDLRGPLRAISGASMILREDFGEILPDEAQRHLLRQAEAAKKMGALIDDLLKLSRIGRQEMRPEPFDMSTMAIDVAGDLGILERVDVQPSMDAVGDARLIRFVLLNLLENAIKFAPDETKIKVGQIEDAYFVRDEGIGFEMQYVDKIFMPFERLVSAEDYPGTGIGLANVHRIVTRHGGRIWAESELGKGATFYFTLKK